MSKQNRDRLEEFFIKGTQNYQFEYDEKDWLEMEKKLDQADDKPFPFWKKNGLYILIATVALLSLSLFWFTSDNVRPQQSRETAISELKSDPGTDARQESSVSGSTVNENNRSPEVQADTFPIDEQLNNRPKVSKEQLAEKNKTGDSGHSDEQSNSEGLNESQVATIDEPKGISDVLQNRSENTYSAEEKSTSENNVAAGFGNGSYQEVEYLAPFGLTGGSYQFQPIQIQGIGSSEPEEQELIEEDDSEIYHPVFSFGVTLSPDLSAVGISGYSKPGTRLGAFLSGSLSNRFSLRTGAVLTQNIYRATGEQYNPNVGSYSGWITPESAKGECKLIDIPFSLRYDILQRERNRWFLTGGLTTYIMLNEKYEFQYNNPQPNAMDGWQSDKTSAHILGLINLSTGYEHFLAPGWSFQVEPFVNIPITGIGWGKVDLYSVGTYFTIKRNFYRRK